MRKSSYNSNLILLVDFGKYREKRKSPPSIDQIPLIDFNGFGYLSFLSTFHIGKYDKKQIGHVLYAYNNFPVTIKCMGKGGKCDNRAKNIVLSYEMVHKHEMEGGPEWKKQILFEGDYPFFCEKCANDYKMRFSENRGRGVERFDISFGTIPKNRISSWHLDRKRLHLFLKRIAYEVPIQGLVIDPNDIENKRMNIGYEHAKEIVNKLLVQQENIPLFDQEKQFIKRKLYTLRGKPKPHEKKNNQLELDF